MRAERLPSSGADPLIHRWVQQDTGTWVLCRVVEQPRLDGFGTRTLVPLALFVQDSPTGPWHRCALPNALLC